MLNFLKQNIKQSRALILFLLAIAGLNVYFLYKYRVGDIEMKQLSFSVNTDLSTVVVYTKSADRSGTDFTRPLQGHVENGQLVFDFPFQKTRTFGIYFGKKEDKTLIENLKLIDREKTEYLSLSDLKFNKLEIIASADRTITFSGEEDASFELRYERITFSEFLLTEVVIFLSSLLLSFAILRFTPGVATFRIRDLDFKTSIVSAFFLTIFLPIPIFNITFISSLILTIRGFNYRKFISGIPGLLFLGYFLYFMINNIFISESYNSRMTETYYPFLFLPIYFASIPQRNYVKLFPISALVLSLCFFATSFINVAIYKNAEYFSFDYFTKYVHPIYFSYLLFFSIVYIELDDKITFSKTIYLPILILALICCGSKLIISLTLLFYFIRFMKKQIVVASLILLLAVISILLFAPTRKRFQEIVETKNLSILPEKPIQSFHDPRLNGLTLRLILWQESLTAFDGVKDVLFGKGVDDNADRILTARLVNRGLEPGHTRYDPHNQFIATYYKMGLIGLGILIFICVYFCYSSYKTRNTLLFYCMILFITAMFTESVLQRVLGIYFFICILLLNSNAITKSSRHFENSDTGDQGHSQ